MSVRPGELLEEASTGTARFRLTKLLVEGRSFYIYEGADTRLDDLPVIIKILRLPANAPAAQIGSRREALEIEVEALTVPSVLLPEPIDFFSTPRDEGGTEPVLVLELQTGRTLREEVSRLGQPLTPARALKLTRELAMAIGELHSAGFVFRDLNPDHVIIGIDDIIQLVGTGNIARQHTAPCPDKQGFSARYSAPEVRGEPSGKGIGARADVYSLVALLSFMLTGADPAPMPEAPLSVTAHRRISAMDTGYQLLIARGLAAPKARFNDIAELVSHLGPDRLPRTNSPGFRGLTLPAPHSAPSHDLAVTGSKPADRDDQPSTTVLAKPATQPPWWSGCLPWLAAPIALVIVGVVVLLSCQF